MGFLPDTFNCGLRMRRECRERFHRHRFQRKPLINYPGMHHGTCVTHVSWYLSRSLTRCGEENVPGFPNACATLNFSYLVRGPWPRDTIICTRLPLYCVLFGLLVFLTTNYLFEKWLDKLPWNSSISDSHTKLRIINRSAPNLATDSSCGVWSREWMAWLLFVGPILGLCLKWRW